MVRFYLRSSVLILSVTCLAKLITVFGTERILIADDPIFNISNRHLLILAAGTELATIFAIIRLKNQAWSCLLSAILGAQFLLYRTFFAIGNYSGGCPCLGRLNDWIPLSQKSINIVLWSIAGWLCAAGFLGFLACVINEGQNRFGNLPRKL